MTPQWEHKTKFNLQKNLLTHYVEFEKQYFRTTDISRIPRLPGDGAQAPDQPAAAIEQQQFHNRNSSAHHPIVPVPDATTNGTAIHKGKFILDAQIKSGEKLDMNPRGHRNMLWRWWSPIMRWLCDVIANSLSLYID